MDYLLGVDVGSSFVKAALFDTEGRALGSAHFANHPAQSQPGVAEYDGEAMLHAIVAALRDLLARADVDAGQIAALALDGMQSGVMGVDAHGQPTTPYTTTLDTRFAPYLDRVMARHEESIRRISGAAQPCYAPKVQWVRAAFPDAYACTFRFMTVGDYLTCRLTGRTGDELFFGSTYLWMTGISDTRHSTWSEELCTALEIAPELLPPIMPATAVVGGVTADVAAATGLRAGTPVVAGCGDQMAGFLGAGITRPGRAGDVAGTYPVLAFCTDQFRPDLTYRRTEILPSTIGGLYNPISFINGGGLTHHWFLNQFGGTGETGFALLDAAAADVPPGAEGLLFNPHLGGRACPTDTHLRGGWLGFTWAHTRAHFYRALLEAIAYDHAEALQTLRSAYPEVPATEVRVFGGGARSDLWNQIKADVLGVPYLRLERDDIGTLGAALLAGCGVGLVTAPAKTAEAFVRVSRRYEPDPNAHAAYRPYVKAYTGMLHDLKPAYTRLAAFHTS